MGKEIFKESFTPAEYREFSQRLNRQLGTLRECLQSESFSRGAASIGAELEIYLVDENYLPASANDELLQLANHPQFTPELNRYNMELNLTPVPAAGSPFAAVEAELRQFLNLLHGHGRSMGIDVIPIGILPTLQARHLSPSYMTDRPRYHALSKGLCGVMGKRFNININGADRLTLQGEGVSAEGANTSFQVHLRVPAADFPRIFNAAQLTAPLVLALSGNSPLIAGKRLWQESRIALFKQSIDFRERENPDWSPPSRVTFGRGWVRQGAWELFAENVALYEPLIPVLYDDAPDAPHEVALPELCLHHGTVWPWNRAVFGGDHLRVEFRSLPAGPTVIDMMANAALSIGWAMGLGDFINQSIAGLPFRIAEYNFYRAAQHGLDANIVWPKEGGGGLGERPVVEVIEEFMPLAHAGVKALGVDAADAARLWKVIDQRLETRRTGAAWQLAEYERYRDSCSMEEACGRMLSGYIDNVVEGQPVASWPWGG